MLFYGPHPAYIRSPPLVGAAGTLVRRVTRSSGVRWPASRAPQGSWFGCRRGWRSDSFGDGADSCERGDEVALPGPAGG